MSREPARGAHRIPLEAEALIRGACGVFTATTADISLTGVRVRLAREELRLAPEAELVAAAVGVQTRIGSRFAIEVTNAQTDQRVRKKVDLVRLVLPGSRPECLDLGCVFATPLTMGEIDVLDIQFPMAASAAGEPVREALRVDEEAEPRFHPSAAQEKVERLFDVESRPRPARGSAVPQRPLRAVVLSTSGRIAAPLVCEPTALTDGTVQVRIDTRGLPRARAWRGASISDIAAELVEAYGEWPELELTAGTQRMWRGTAHIYGLEFCDPRWDDMILRLAFHRRLGEEELARLLAA